MNVCPDPAREIETYAESIKGVVKTTDTKFFKCLSFTWSPAGETIDYYGCYVMFLKYIMRQLDENKRLDYVIIAEVNISGNIHFHGKLLCRTKGSYYKVYKTLLGRMKRLGFVSLKECFDVQGWDKYLLKDISETINKTDKRLMNIMPLTNFNAELIRSHVPVRGAWKRPIISSIV